MRNLFLALVLGILPLYSAHAALITIDFEGFTPTAGWPGGIEDGVSIVTGGDAPELFPEIGFGSGNLVSSNFCCGFSSTFDFMLVGGGTFGFESFDLSGVFIIGDPVTVEGFLGGVSQGTDNYTTSSTRAGSGLVNEAALNLAGLPIDMLRITLNNQFDFPVMDNIVLDDRVSAAPTPATFALFSFGLAGLGWSRRKQNSWHEMR